MDNGDRHTHTGKHSVLSFGTIVDAKLAARKLSANVAVKNKKSNIGVLRERRSTSKVSPISTEYKPVKSEKFLSDWLDFPLSSSSPLLGTATLGIRWLLWSNRAMASLHPNDCTIRERLCNSIAVLGSAAGLFLVLAVAGFLGPPTPVNFSSDTQEILLAIYGVLMFYSLISFLFYIGYALTVLYPLLQSIRDDLQFDCYEHFKACGGGAENYLFISGLYALTWALMVAAALIYPRVALIIIFFLYCGFLAVVVWLTRVTFCTIDPISAMHMNLTNDSKVIRRAELISQYIMSSIPNHILDESEFHERRKSVEVTVNNYSKKGEADLGTTADTIGAATTSASLSNSTNKHASSSAVITDGNTTMEHGYTAATPQNDNDNMHVNKDIVGELHAIAQRHRNHNIDGTKREGGGQHNSSGRC